MSRRVSEDLYVALTTWRQSLLRMADCPKDGPGGLASADAGRRRAAELIWMRETQACVQVMALLGEEDALQ